MDGISGSVHRSTSTGVRNAGIIDFGAQKASEHGVWWDENTPTQIKNKPLRQI